MRKVRTSFLVLIFLLASVFTASKVNEKGAATPAATLVATLAPTPTREVEAHSTPRPLVVTAIRTAEPSTLMLVNADGLNLRDKPAGHVVGSLQRGVELMVKIGGDWALVTDGVHKGRYVAARYLRAK